MPIEAVADEIELKRSRLATNWRRESRLRPTRSLSSLLARCWREMRPSLTVRWPLARWTLPGRSGCRVGSSRYDSQDGRRPRPSHSEVARPCFQLKLATNYYLSPHGLQLWNEFQGVHFPHILAANLREV